MRSVHWSTLRSVRILNDPYGWNEQKIILTDRYDAGILDNPRDFRWRYRSVRKRYKEKRKVSQLVRIETDMFQVIHKTRFVKKILSLYVAL